jgi:hypothetical protein
MALVFQLGSEDNLHFMFGDSGVAHVTQCPQHPDRSRVGLLLSRFKRMLA